MFTNLIVNVVVSRCLLIVNISRRIKLICYSPLSERRERREDPEIQVPADLSLRKLKESYLAQMQNFDADVKRIPIRHIPDTFPVIVQRMHVSVTASRHLAGVARMRVQLLLVTDLYMTKACKLAL